MSRDAALEETTDIYIASKPLQILHLMAIARKLPRRPRLLFVVRQFLFDASVCAMLGGQECFDDLITVPSPFAVPLHRVNNPGRIFYYSDIGLKSAVFLKLLRLLYPRAEIHLYEEGEANYRVHVGSFSRLKRAIYAKTGIATYFGQSPLIHRYWVTRPDEVPNARPEILETFTGFADDLGNYEDLVSQVGRLIALPEREAGDRTCILYLTDWIIRPDLIQTMMRESSLFFVKLHPHLRRATLDFGDGVRTLRIAAPAELAILYLRDLYGQVKVYNHGSSASFYLRDLPGIEFVRV